MTDHFYIICIPMVLFLFVFGWNDFIRRSFYKSKLDYETKVNQPNQKNIKKHAELVTLSLSKEDQKKAINRMQGIIDAQLDLEKEEYSIRSKSLVCYFDCPVAFAFAQLHFNSFEEKGTFKETDFSFRYSFMIDTTKTGEKL